MANNETIGRCTCPVCGLEAQDVRLSAKNGLMYIYCENNCRVWFSGRTKKFTDQIKSGYSQQVGKIFIKSIKQREFTTNEQYGRIEQPTTNGSITGVATGRRDTGEPIGSDRSIQSKKSWLARAWSDDDTDDE